MSLRRFRGLRSPERWRTILPLVAAVFLVGCQKGTSGVPRALTLRVEFAGCQTVLEGPVCVLPPHRELRLWVAATPTDARLELSAGGQSLPDAGVAVGGGRRFVLTIPKAAGELVLRAVAPTGEAHWRLPLAELERPEWYAAALEELGQGEASAELRRELEEAANGVDAAERGLASAFLARFAWRRGATEEAARLLSASVAAFREAGRPLDEARQAQTLVHLLREQRRFTEARTVLADLETHPALPALATCWLSYYRGVLAAEVGKERSAIYELRDAAERAERVGLEKERSMAQQMLAWQLQRVGRSQEAAELFARLAEDEPEESPCDRAVMLDNHAWVLLLAREAGASAGDPLPRLEEARQIFDHEGCALPEDRANVLTNLALAHLQNGEPQAARDALAKARDVAENPSPLQALWWLEIEGRVALGEGRYEQALHLYARLDELAASVLSPEARWRSAVGRARAHEGLGRRAEALADLAAAERLLGTESLDVPLQEGRESFLAQRQPGTRFYLELLLQEGRTDDAFSVARRARSRLLRGLLRGERLAQLGPREQERWDRAIADYQNLRAALDAAATTDWRLSSEELSQVRQARAGSYAAMRRALEEAFAVLGDGAMDPAAPLPPPGPGELVLAYHPLPDGWVGFAAHGETVLARRIKPFDGELSRPAALAARLLEPFTAQIAEAETLRLLPFGNLREVDFHALPFGGDVLLASLPVTYGLDLGRAPRIATGTGGRALVVADPRGDLPAARREAEEVRAALTAQDVPWSVETLEGTAARADAVRRALAEADWFHYAGHAVYAGRAGWESALPLAGHSRLTLGDLLALKRPPERVVLSGCETARAAAGTVESVGLAHAFLLAGTRYVVAAVRPVGDRAAAGLFTELYARWSSAPRPAEALRQAQLSWRRQDPDADWASFRILEP